MVRDARVVLGTSLPTRLQWNGSSANPDIHKLLENHIGKMHVRHLLCLAVHSGECAHVSVEGKDAAVASLRMKLRDKLRDAPPPASQLELFMAKDDQQQWLVMDHKDAKILTKRDPDARTDAHVESCRRYMTQDHEMYPKEWLTKYFPQQPPRRENNAQIVHVLAFSIPRPSPGLNADSQRPGQVNCDKKAIANKFGQFEHECEQKHSTDIQSVTAQPAQIPPVEAQQVVDQPTKAQLAEAQSTETIPVEAQPAEGPSMEIHPVKAQPFVEQPVEAQLVQAPAVEAAVDDTIRTPDTPPLFVRPCWNALRSSIMKWLTGEHDNSKKASGGARHANVTGPTGVGKSMFVRFVVTQWLEIASVFKYRNMILDIPGDSYKCLRCDGTMAVGAARGVDFRHELEQRDSLYVFDPPSLSINSSRDGEDTGVVRPLNTPRACSLIVRVSAGDRRVAAKRFKKKTFFMPLWSLSELEGCRLKCYPQIPSTIVEALFHVWGGMPTRVLTADASAGRRTLEFALAAIDEHSIGELLHSLQKSGRPGRVGAAKFSKLVVQTARPAANATESSSDGEWSFCSQYVCDRVLERMRVHSSQTLALERSRPSVIWWQIRQSLEYLKLEEEEKDCAGSVEV